MWGRTFFTFWIFVSGFQFDAALQEFLELAKGSEEDGISLAELTNYYSESAAEVMNELDKNGDGQLEFAEVK